MSDRSHTTNGDSTNTVVVATANRGKVRELAEALAQLDLQLITQAELGIASAPETGVTFVENALAKARHAAAASGLPAIADDSGLVVPALGGAPGIVSARYAGEPPNDDANNAKLLEALAKTIQAPAYFYCALVHLETADDPTPTLASGRWDGVIVHTPQGENGFGYDPHFFIPALNKTAAQLILPEKNRLSHRGQASRELAARLLASR